MGPLASTPVIVTLFIPVRTFWGEFAPVYFALSEGARQERFSTSGHTSTLAAAQPTGVLSVARLGRSEVGAYPPAPSAAGATAIEARLVRAFVGLTHGVGRELPAFAPTPWRESSTGRPGGSAFHPQPHEGR